MMTLDEFDIKFCAMCGSQRCGGIYDEAYREGCKFYKMVYPYGEYTTICGEDGCDGCLWRHADRLDLCIEKRKQKLTQLLNGC